MRTIRMLAVLGPRLRWLSMNYLTDSRPSHHRALQHSMLPAILRHSPFLEHLEVDDLRLGDPESVCICARLHCAIDKRINYNKICIYVLFDSTLECAGSSICTGVSTLKAIETVLLACRDWFLHH